jgi:hypothetical protein
MVYAASDTRIRVAIGFPFGLEFFLLLSYTLICTQPSIEGGSTHVLPRNRPEKPAPFTRRDRLGEIVLSGRCSWGNRP